MHDAYPGEADVVIAGTSVPVCEALDNCDLIFTTGGDALWIGQVSTTHDGVDAIKSGNTDNDETVVLETTVTGPVVIKFWWKVSSEEDYDFLTFYLDSSSQRSISGEVDWQQQTISIPSGSHQLQWKYSKDIDASEGDDCGWVDQVEIFAGGLKGDLNGDGRVDLADTIIGLQVITGQNPAMLRKDYVTSGADVNGDNKAGLQESNYILQKVSGLR
jgi:hypothetical protein